jgi:hypothetical protein
MSNEMTIEEATRIIEAFRADPEHPMTAQVIRAGEVIDRADGDLIEISHGRRWR